MTSLVLPASGTPSLALLVLGGSSGRVEEQRARVLAGHGIAALAVPWFGAPGLPDTPRRVPLESLLPHLDRLASVAPRIGVLGTSFGAEAALLLGVRDPRVALVAALAPTSVVWQTADLDDRDRPIDDAKWTWRGERVVGVPYVDQTAGGDFPDARTVHEASLAACADPAPYGSRSRRSPARCWSAPAVTTGSGRPSASARRSSRGGAPPAGTRRTSSTATPGTGSCCPARTPPRTGRGSRAAAPPRRTPSTAAPCWRRCVHTKLDQLSRLSAMTIDILPLPDVENAEVVVPAPAPGPGNWAGAASATLVDGDVWLTYRVRRPIAEGRGVSTVVARSSDGVHFETVSEVWRDDFGAESFERPVVLRRPDGGWRLYVSCATPGLQALVDRGDRRRHPGGLPHRRPHRRRRG